MAVLLYLRFGDRRIAQQAIDVKPRSAAMPLKVVTLNAHLLPPIADRLIAQRSMPDYRAREIAGQLQRFDIVGICEAFSEKQASRMIDAFNANEQPEFCVRRSRPPGKYYQFTSGGLILLSRLPILESNTISFNTGSRFLSTAFQAADGLADKGVVHARIQPGRDSTRSIDCYLTHLESHSESIRKNQVTQLSEFIRTTHQPGNALLVLGDLNIAGPESKQDALHPTGDAFAEYRWMMDELQSGSIQWVDTALVDEARALGTSDAVSRQGGLRIDYILWGQSTPVTSPRSLTYGRLPLFDDRVSEGSLSDHAAVWCQIDPGLNQTGKQKSGNE